MWTVQTSCYKECFNIRNVSQKRIVIAIILNE